MSRVLPPEQRALPPEHAALEEERINYQADGSIPLYSKLQVEVSIT